MAAVLWYLTGGEKDEEKKGGCFWMERLLEMGELGIYEEAQEKKIAQIAQY